MSRAIRFTVAEFQAVKQAEVAFDGDHEMRKHHKALKQLLVKMEAASVAKSHTPGLGFKTFHTICKNVLAERLVVPLNITDEYSIIVAKAVRLAGLTEDQALKAALEARRRWKGKVKLESIARQANVLLSAEEVRPADAGRWTLDEGDST